MLPATGGAVNENVTGALLKVTNSGEKQFAGTKPILGRISHSFRISKIGRQGGFPDRTGNCSPKREVAIPPPEGGWQ